MFQIDFRSRKPIYEQIINNFKRLIITNVIKPDEKLMSVRELSKMLSTNPNTIQKAYRELERQGYIYSIPGKGNFASKFEVNNENEILEEKTKVLNEIIQDAIYKGIPKEKILYIVEDIYSKFKQSKGEFKGDRS